LVLFCVLAAQNGIFLLTLEYQLVNSRVADRQVPQSTTTNSQLSLNTMAGGMDALQ